MRLRVPSALAVALLLAACASMESSGLPGGAAPVVKIGVIAPFEGAGRDLGYAVLPAIKAAVAEANADGSLGRYRVLVVAFNDNLDPKTAAAQARALALDGDVLAVVGPFTESTARAAKEPLDSARLAALPVISADPLAKDHHGDAQAAAGAARSALSALSEDIRAAGAPTRAGVARRLATQP